MAFTLEQVDQKITQAQAVLDYWMKVREILNNPLFAELSSDGPKPSAVPTVAVSPPAWPGPAKPQYGQLKKAIYECLPDTGTGVTSKELIELISKTGFVFKT